jgi:hypothetical protein
MNEIKNSCNFSNGEENGAGWGRQMNNGFGRSTRKCFCGIVAIQVFGIASTFAQELSLTMPPPPSETTSTSSPASILCLLLLGAVLGFFGQIARSAVGIKKELDAAPKGNAKWDGWFNVWELVISLLLGAAAGAFACLLMWGEPLDKTYLLACVAAGYAGSDFIQGFIQKYIPNAKNEGKDSSPSKTGTQPPAKPSAENTSAQPEDKITPS